MLFGDNKNKKTSPQFLRCDNDYDCGDENYECRFNQCLKRLLPKKECTFSKDCASGQYCFAGKCVSRKTSPSDGCGDKDRPDGARCGGTTGCATAGCGDPADEPCCNGVKKCRVDPATGKLKCVCDDGFRNYCISFCESFNALFGFDASGCAKKTCSECEVCQEFPLFSQCVPDTSGSSPCWCSDPENSRDCGPDGGWDQPDNGLACCSYMERCDCEDSDGKQVYRSSGKICVPASGNVPCTEIARKAAGNNCDRACGGGRFGPQLCGGREVCKPGYKCKDGKCQKICFRNSDCVGSLNGSRCIDGECGCTGDPDCPDGYICKSGKCEKDPCISFDCTTIIIPSPTGQKCPTDWVGGGSYQLRSDIYVPQGSSRRLKGCICNDVTNECKEIWEICTENDVPDYCKCQSSTDCPECEICGSDPRTNRKRCMRDQMCDCNIPPLNDKTQRIYKSHLCPWENFYCFILCYCTRYCIFGAQPDDPAYFQCYIAPGNPYWTAGYYNSRVEIIILTTSPFAPDPCNATGGCFLAYGLCNSDYRLKRDVSKVENVIDRILSIEPRNFRLKSGVSVSSFDPQNISKISPEAVDGMPGIDDNGNLYVQVVHEEKLVPLLAAGIKELLNEIDELKAKIKALDNR